MTFVIYLVIMLVMLAISEYTRPVPEDARPAGLGDFQFNTASEDRHIPVIWGKPINPGMNVLWHGDLTTVPIVKEINGLFHDDEYTVGYMYFMGMHLGFSVGDSNTKLLKIWVGDQEFADFGAGISGGRQYVGNAGFLGGEDRNGGMMGNIQFFPGYAGQGRSGYLVGVLGNMVPEFNKVSSIVWEGGYVGNSIYLGQWEVQLQRLPRLLGTNQHDIDGEANPAEMLYELIVNNEWGMSVSPSLVEVSSFTSAAAQLKTEGMGMSLIWDQGKTIETIIKEILKHIDGVLFLNALTGKFQLTLMREVTNPQSLPVLNNTNSKMTSYSRPGIDELVNEVKIIYTDLVNRKDKMVHAQDLGQYMAFDKQIVSIEVQYKGFTKKDLALRCAERDLRRSSYPLAMVRLENVHRSFSSLVPGSKFIFQDEELGIEQIIMVVMDIDYGSQTQGKIQLEAIQDVFALGATTIYTTPDDSQFTPVDGSAQPITEFKLMEAPYYFNKVSSSTGAYSPIYGTTLSNDPNRADWMRPMILAKDPTGNSLGFRLWKSYNSLPYVQEGVTRRMTPVGVLEYDFDFTPPVNTDSSARRQDLVIRSYNLPKSGGALSSVTDDEEITVNARNLIVIDDEIIAYKTIQFIDPYQNLLRVTECWRGMLDTVKARHKAGAIVWFISLGNASTSTNYYYGNKSGGVLGGDPSAVALKFGSIGITGAQSVDEASGGTLTNAGRAYKPYCPDNIKINGEDSGTTRFIGANDNIVVTWEHVNRLTQNCVGELSPSVTPETGTKYYVNIYDGSGQLRHTSPAQTGTSYTFLKTTENGIAGFSYDGAMSVEVYSTRDVTLLNSTVAAVHSAFSERIYFHRDIPAPTGDYYDMIMGSRPVGYWGIEE